MNKKIASTLTILIVDDDKVVSKLISKMLEGRFKKIVLAYDGEEGFERYKEGGIDLIISDNVMPKLKGSQMISKIREIDENVPVIMMTAYMDKKELIDFINLRVTQFLPKPFKKDLLLKALDVCVDKVVTKAIKRKSDKLELELLRLKEKKQVIEEGIAFKKEINIIKNDFYYKFIEYKNSANKIEEYYFDIYYKPLEVLSGDIYSIRKISNQKILFFAIDTLGKGLLASVTSIISSSLLNHKIDEFLKEKDSFDIKKLIEKYIEFIKNEILEDESISILFALYDLKEQILDFASFGMPAVLLQKNNDEIEKIKSNNLPIMKYTDSYETESYFVGDIKKFLFYSDGLVESRVKEDGLYMEYIKEDFNNSACLNGFISKVQSRVESFDDDVTIFYISKNSDTTEEPKEFLINSRLSEIDKVIEDVQNYFERFTCSQEYKQQFVSALYELIVNAYEHGNFAVSYDMKQRLLESGEYEDYLIAKEKELADKKKIRIKLFSSKKDTKRCITAQICDEGDGFDTIIFKNRYISEEIFHGRGLAIAKKMVDSLYYNEKGNKVLIKKFFEEKI
jgi:CheY-like chemotaxis protein/anti-sigma regulatory factor (Ser/Thr protein kinase)